MRSKNPMSDEAAMVSEALRLVVEERPLLMLGIPGAVVTFIGIVLGVSVLLDFNATRYFGIPMALLALFAVAGGVVLVVSGMILYAIARIGRKIEQKGHE